MTVLAIRVSLETTESIKLTSQQGGPAMKEESTAFRDEGDALYALLKPLKDEDWNRPTLFKGWTFNDIIAHLHGGNESADISLRDAAAHARMKSDREQMAKDRNLDYLGITHAWIGDIKGRELLEAWRERYLSVAEAFAVADPKKRVPWAGREMSARSSISARLMETWAHGQAIYDRMDRERVNTDRIRNIAVLCVNTFGWTFANRKMTPPPVRAAVRLIAPSGALWEWPSQPADEAGELIEGSAAEFCQVCAQTRNIADTRLKVTGESAKRWMALAQCFAGVPRDPPGPGVRHRQAA
jgi:uncharacterized protein (TIGR03084 family)